MNVYITQARRAVAQVLDSGQPTGAVGYAAKAKVEGTLIAIYNAEHRSVGAGTPDVAIYLLAYEWWMEQDEDDDRPEFYQVIESAED